VIHSFSSAAGVARQSDESAMVAVSRAPFLALSLLVTAGLHLGCTTAHLVDNRYQDDHVSYTIGQPGAGWVKMHLEKANVAWHQPDLAAGMFLNSTCGGVQDAPLTGLSNELLIGSTEREILQQELVPWSHREALETVVTCKLDGVARKRILFVIKKDGCVYDLVYDAPPEHFDDGLASYRAVRDGLDIAARRDRTGS
jgi:hypothetical protein